MPQIIEMPPQDSQDVPATSPRPERPSVLTEGLLIALASALSYSVAFAYESGFAVTYGLPLAVIDLNLTAVLIASIAVLVPCGYLIHVWNLGVPLFTELPQTSVWQAVRWVFVPPALTAVGLLLIVGLDSWRTIAQATTTVGIAGVVFWLVAIELPRRRTNAEQVTFEEQVASAEERAPQVATLLVNSLGRSGLLSLAGAVTLLLLGFWIAEDKASNEVHFFVVERDRQYVVLRIYDGIAYSAALGSDGHTIERLYRAFPLADTSIALRRQHLGKLKLAPFDSAAPHRDAAPTPLRHVPHH